MKTIFCFLLSAFCISAQTLNVTTANVGTLTKAAAAPSGGLLIHETFENVSVGYDGPVWTTESGTPDPKHTARFLSGAQSFFCTPATAYVSSNFTASASVWVAFEIYSTNWVRDANWIGIQVSTAGAQNAKITMEDNAGRLYARSGTCGSCYSDPETPAMSNSVTNYILFHAAKGTGGDGVYSVEWNTNNHFYGAGSVNYSSRANSDVTENFMKLYIGTANPCAVVIDHIRLWDADPGADPP